MASMWQTGKLAAPALLARAPQIASIVLGLAIAAQAIAIALALSGDLSAGGATGISASARGLHISRPALADITAAHLFGTAFRQTKLADAAAVSHSPLVLTGTLATRDPQDGFAILGTSVENTHAIYVGSQAAPGTVLVAVYPKWVVLQRGDERLKLRLPEKGLMSGPARASHGNRMLLSEAAPAPETNGDSGGGAFAMPAPLPRPQMTDGAAVLHSFSMVAATVDGQQGMRIAGTVFNRKALAALGLHSGDVILQVNGAPIGSPNGDLIRAVQSGAATLTVVSRNGDSSSVTLDADTMASAAALYRQAAPDL